MAALAICTVDLGKASIVLQSQVCALFDEIKETNLGCPILNE